MMGSAVGPFVMFIEYGMKEAGERHCTKPILLKADTEKEAVCAAIAIAESAFLEIASDVLIRVIGRDDSRPIAEIRRPISD